ncbi:5'/3'-nucleotidase SurE [Dactylosporangium vinaceum]|uniref:5'-nucleotidase n=1 Tax=Dactylosporangium vinaceum TaxID=53362 RepID=A0ABV5M6I2_9ACTN|nr:5'/3'-nucleotidase SurE [Dactylosporangium vinaceum]UAB97881.1 5'/3'-nucleotidase SurE [Dactylosporangium vinaceum]
MRLLITNDDGIRAPGLRALALAAAQAGHDVTVAAPHQEQSGAGAALSAVTDQGRVILEPVPFDGLRAFSVAASPAYIAVLAALEVFGPAPDALLSGINRGANAGHAILHSGTVGAALTAANEGLRALAVSLDVLTSLPSASQSVQEFFREREGEVLHWSTAATLAVRLLPRLAAAPPSTVLNLNVPDRPLPELRGLRRATPAPFGQVRMAVAEAAAGFARITVEVREDASPPGTDLALLTDGYATLTALRPPSEDPDLLVVEDLGDGQASGRP